MAGRDVLTTRVGDMVKVEIKDRTNPHGTLPNYGNVQPVRPDHLPGSEYDTYFRWALASGENGTATTEQKAINGAARAIRKHAERFAQFTRYIGIDYSGGICDNCDQHGRVLWHLHLVRNEDHEQLCQNCLPDPMPSLPHRFE